MSPEESSEISELRKKIERNVKVSDIFTFADGVNIGFSQQWTCNWFFSTFTFKTGVFDLRLWLRQVGATAAQSRQVFAVGSASPANDCRDAGRYVKCAAPGLAFSLVAVFFNHAYLD